MEKYIQKEGESRVEYGLRLVEILKTERPEDLDWDDIKTLIQFEGNKDSLRKANDTFLGGYQIHKFYEGKIKEIINNKDDNSVSYIDNKIKELDDKVKEFEKEKYKMQDQKREYRSFLKIDSRWEHLEEEIIRNIKDLNVSRPLINQVMLSDNISNDVEASLILSDWHTGLETENHWNKFNIEILKQRVNNLTEKTIRYCYDNNVNVLHVELLGDLINGLIHISTRIYNEEDTIQQVMICSEIISEMLYEFSKHLDKVCVYSTIGNHGRVSANVKEHINTENFEKLIPWFLKARVQCSNVEFMDNKYDEDIIVYQVHGEYIFGLHGHHEKIAKVVDDWTKMLRIFPREIHLGHYHRHYETEEYDILVTINGCLSGVDQYAKDIRKTNSPMQKLIIYKKGESDSFSYRIKL
jgi:hypothetical protein